jgi:hypothetical protein
MVIEERHESIVAMHEGRWDVALRDQAERAGFGHG